MPEKVEKIPFFTHGIITLNPSESGLTSHKYITFNHFSSWFNLVIKSTVA